MFNRIRSSNPNAEKCGLKKIAFTDYGINNLDVKDYDSHGAKTYMLNNPNLHRTALWPLREKRDISAGDSSTYLASDATLTCPRTEEQSAEVVVLSTMQEMLDREQARKSLVKLATSSLCHVCPYFGKTEAEVNNLQADVMYSDARKLQATLALQQAREELDQL